MLWAFFDESGEHASEAEGGGLRKLTVGGCIASFEVWESLSLDWSSALATMHIPMFHMAAFEARAEPFKNWTPDERKDRLNALLNIIGSARPHCYGFTNLYRPGDSTSSMYERCAHDVLLELGIDQEIAMVFAHHPEFGRHSELVDLLLEYGMGTQIRSCAVARPIDTCPLQMADIVAYEISRDERQTVRRRYPMEKLRKLGCVFRLCGSAD